TQRSSPGSPGSHSRGVRFVAVANALLPRPPFPPRATVTCSPGATRSFSTCPRSRSRTIVPGGPSMTRSSALRPVHCADPPPSTLCARAGLGGGGPGGVAAPARARRKARPAAAAAAAVGPATRHIFLAPERPHPPPAIAAGDKDRDAIDKHASIIPERKNRLR